MKILKDLLYDTRISEIHGTTHTAVEGIGIDSREVKPMGLFIAIKGTQVDGHDYIKQAITNGATTIICEYISEDLIRPEPVTFVVVKKQFNSFRKNRCCILRPPI